jgi:hypothetical protein
MAGNIACSKNLIKIAITKLFIKFDNLEEQLCQSLMTLMLIYLEKQRTSILTSGQIIQIMGIFAIRT